MQNLRPLLTTSAMALALISQNSFAQAGPNDGESLVNDEVIVTGTKLSRETGINAKREALGIIDALGTDELGQLPDKNVGESLNRLAGVSMLVEKGEGRYVQIRGINPSLNNVTINGMGLGSPETENGGRQAPLDIIAGGVLGAVQVIKTPTPDMDAQGIGGTVNVETKSPFDRPDSFYGYLSGRFGFEEIQPEDEAYGGHNPYSIDATLSGKTDDDTFGWLIGGSWSDREYVAPGYYQDDWVEQTGGAAPENVKNNYYIIGRERLNLNGTVEFRPDDVSKYFARGFYAKWDEFQHRNRYEQNFTEDIVYTSANGGTSGLNRIAANIRLESPEKEIFSLSAGGQNIVDNLTFDYLGQYNKNTISEPYSYWEWRSGTDFGPNSFEINADGVVSITPDAGTPDRQDASLLPFRRARFQDSDMTEDGLMGQFDVSWEKGADTIIKAGVKARQTDRDWDYQLTRYDGGALDLNLATSSDFTSGAFQNCSAQGCPPNIFMNIDAMDAFLAEPSNSDYFVLNTSENFIANFASDYRIKETVLAGYVMGTKTYGPAQIITGVRIEATDVNSSGFLLEGEDAVEVEDGGDYINVLPALLINYDVSETLKARGAITRALGRPDFTDIAPRSSFSEELTIGDLSIGNPDLKPRLSWNFDASLEWYANSLTLLSASVFYKDISDDLVGLSERYTTQADIEAQLEARGLNGAIDASDLTELNIDTTVNSGSSTLKGLELVAQTQLDPFLPEALSGIGVSATATFLDGETEVNGVTLPLLNQAEMTYALTLFYQNHGFDASVSYAYNDDFLTGVNLDNPGLNLSQGKFGRFDAKVSYDVMDQLKVFAEAVNINDEPTTEFQGGIETQNTEHEYVGRTIYVGFSYGF